MLKSPVAGLYDKPHDRQSAFEELEQGRAGRRNSRAGEARQAQARQESAERRSRDRQTRSSSRETPAEALAKSMARSVGRSSAARSCGVFWYHFQEQITACRGSHGRSEATQSHNERTAKETQYG